MIKVDFDSPYTQCSSHNEQVITISDTSLEENLINGDYKKYSETNYQSLFCTIYRTNRDEY